MTDNKEISYIFSLFSDKKLIGYKNIDSSRGENDFREIIIGELETGEKLVVKLSDNDFTFPDKIKMWQRTAEEYLKLGYYCPRILSDKQGGFPAVRYKNRNCVVYAEEYAKYRPAEYYPPEDNEPSSDDKKTIPYEKYADDAWIMTAQIAGKYFSYTDYPSGYCLFECFCPSDKTDEVLEEAIKWKEYADTLPEEFRSQTERIWKLWTDNRNALEPVYKKLPTSVFQADLNPTNILIDESGNFAGVFDFNLCGKDVFLNYLFREIREDTFEKELQRLCRMIKLVSGYYHFSEPEKQSALMLYRCLKPLMFKTDELKALKDDEAALKKFLDETEEYLTKDIDFISYME